MILRVQYQAPPGTPWEPMPGTYLEIELLHRHTDGNIYPITLGELLSTIKSPVVMWQTLMTASYPSK